MLRKELKRRRKGKGGLGLNPSPALRSHEIVISYLASELHCPHLQNGKMLSTAGVFKVLSYVKCPLCSECSSLLALPTPPRSHNSLQQSVQWCLPVARAACSLHIMRGICPDLVSWFEVPSPSPPSSHSGLECLHFTPATLEFTGHFLVTHVAL